MNTVLIPSPAKGIPFLIIPSSEGNTSEDLLANIPDGTIWLFLLVVIALFFILIMFFEDK